MTDQIHSDTMIRAVVQRAEQEFDIRGFTHDGWSTPPFLNPHNPMDRNAAAHIHKDTGVIHDFGGESKMSHSLIDSAILWGIPIEYANGNNGAQSNGQVNMSLTSGKETKENFAEKRGTTWEAYLSAGWRVGIYNNRECLQFLTANGKRNRYIDGKRPRFGHDFGYTSCWYGLSKAIVMAETTGFIVLVNGESSTVAAQDNGIPACCITTSGERRIPDNLLRELNELYDGLIYIALDCDQKGREASAKIHAQLPGSIVIDLGIDNGDMGDFCYLAPKRDVMVAWKKLINDHRPEEKALFHNQNDVIADWLDYQAGGMKLVNSEPAVMDFPYKSMWKFGGVARVLRARELIAVVASSGGGKTSFLLSLIDHLRRKQGQNVMYWGTEFTALNYLEMLIQRYKGIPTMVWERDRLAIQEDANGVHFSKKRGEHFEDYCTRMRKSGHNIVDKWKISDIMQWIKTLHDNSGHFTNFDHTAPVADMLTMINDRMIFERAKERPVTVLVIDYLQRTPKTKTDGQVPDEYNLSLIDQFTQRNNLVTFIGSQTTKDESRRGKLGNAESIKYATSNKFKGVFNLHVHKDEDMNGDLTERNPELDRIGISKNNRGMTGTQDFTFVGERLKWIERKI